MQEAGNLQNYNRYSYVLNNPLSMTDPSGFDSVNVGTYIDTHFNELRFDSSDLQRYQIRYNDLKGNSSNIANYNYANEITNFTRQFQQAFTGTLLSGGSLGDASRAAFGGGYLDSTNRPSSVSINHSGSGSAFSYFQETLESSAFKNSKDSVSLLSHGTEYGSALAYAFGTRDFDWLNLERTYNSADIPNFRGKTIFKELRISGDFLKGGKKFLGPFASALDAIEALSTIDTNWIGSGSSSNERIARTYLEGITALGRALPLGSIGFGESIGHASFWTYGKIGILSQQEVVEDRIRLRQNADEMRATINQNFSRETIERDAGVINSWTRPSSAEQSPASLLRSN